MFTNYLGDIDMGLAPSAALDVPPDFKWPASLRKLIAAYDKAFDEWLAAELTQSDARGALDQSGAKDDAALNAAVAARKPHPGTPNKDGAIRAAVYSDELARQTAAGVNNLAEEILAALPPHRATLLTQAIKVERDEIAEITRLYAEAQALIESARRIGQRIGTRTSWLADSLGEPRENAIVGQLDDVQWPAPFRSGHHAALAALDRLENATPAEPVKSLDPDDDLTQLQQHYSTP